MMLTEFDNEYGRFPDASTISAVKAETSTRLTLGSSSSNGLFRQLLVAGSGRSENPFWAKTKASPKKCDEVFNSDTTALAPGECGFGYVAGLSSSSDPLAPVVFGPLLPGTRLFDRKQYGGKAIILRVDNSVMPVAINSSGQVIVNGMDLFDPRQPFWKGKAPEIKLPEPPP